MAFENLLPWVEIQRKVFDLVSGLKWVGQDAMASPTLVVRAVGNRLLVFFAEAPNLQPDIDAQMPVLSISVPAWLESTRKGTSAP